jgi:hypothetical protein
MLNVKVSIALAILAATAATSAGAGYLVTLATTQVNVSTHCPASPQSQSRGFLPLGDLPATTGGKQW